MKNTLILLVLLLSGFAQSIEIESRWNYRFEKEVVMSCFDDEYFCEDLCENKTQCVIEEKVCRDCIGSTPYLTHVFNQLGKSIVKSQKAQAEDLLELLETGHFATINSKSIYNHVDRYGSSVVLDKFKALCEVDDPTVFFEVETISKLLGKPKLLVCGQEFFHMDANGGVILSE
jgi:hypothetical protein